MTTHTQQTSRAYGLAVIFAASVLASQGCSDAESPTYPTELEVFVNKKPATGALVVLHPVASAIDHNTRRPSGTVDSTGNVKFSTLSQDDGAPPGDYTVTVVWHDEIKGPDNTKELSSDKLRGRYAKPNSPNAPRVTVQKQPNKLPPLNF